ESRSRIACRSSTTDSRWCCSARSGRGSSWPGRDPSSRRATSRPCSPCARSRLGRFASTAACARRSRESSTRKRYRRAFASNRRSSRPGVALGEGRELFSAAQPVQPAHLTQQSVQPSLHDVPYLERAGTSGGERARQAVAFPLRHVQAGPQRRAVEEELAQLGRAAPAPHCPELQEDRQILVELPLRFDLELRDGTTRPRAVQYVKEVGDALGRRAEPAQSLARPRRVGSSRQLRKDRLAEKQTDMQLVAVFGDEQRLVGAHVRRQPLPERGANEIIASLG